MQRKAVILSIDILGVGAIEEKLARLQNLSQKHDIQFYLYSDIDKVALDKLTEDLESKAVGTIRNTLKDHRKVLLLQDMEFYTTCNFKKGCSDLVKHIVDNIEKKEFENLGETIVILENPENKPSKILQMIAQEECDTLTNFCDEKGVTLQLHTNLATIEDTLERSLVVEKNNEEIVKQVCGL